VLSFDKICFCVPTQKENVKKKQEKFAGLEKMPYLCRRYPENNLFTLEN